MSALARAFFWQERLDSGRVKNMTELAKAEKIGLARMQKMLKLARLAPDIVEDIARGRQPVGLSLLFFVECGEVSVLAQAITDHPEPGRPATMRDDAGSGTKIGRSLFRGSSSGGRSI
ncbi:MAG: hypothetical protein AB1710_03620 [Pseudomonadota bacterium]